MKGNRFMRTSAGAILGGMVVAAGIAVCLAITWFPGFVHDRLLAELRRATGAQISVRAIHFHWRELAADLDNVSLGYGSSGLTPPFFYASRVHLGFKIVSPFRPDVDLDSVSIERPVLDLSSGSRNGAEASRLSRDFRHLHIHRLRIDQGVVRTELSQLDADVSAQDVDASIAAESGRNAYAIVLGARRISIESPQVKPIEADLVLRAEFEDGQLAVQKLVLTSGANRIESSGAVLSLQPFTASVAVHAQLDPAGLAYFGLPFRPEAGRFEVLAKADYAQNRISVKGDIFATDMALRVDGRVLKDIAFQSGITAHGSNIRLENATAHMLGGIISGSAMVRGFDNVEFDGKLNGIQMRAAADVLAGWQLPWAGAISGPFHAVVSLSHASAITARGRLRIAPENGLRPVSGNIDFSYGGRAPGISFQPSELDLPHTQVAFSGTPRGALELRIRTEDLDELTPVLAYAPQLDRAIPSALRSSPLAFDGEIDGFVQNPQIRGLLALAHFPMAGKDWGPVRCQANLSSASAEFLNFTAGTQGWHSSGSASFALQNWSFQPDGKFFLRARFSGLDIAGALAAAQIRFPAVTGKAFGSVDISGTPGNPLGPVALTLRNLSIGNEHVDAAEMAANLEGDRLRIQRARIDAGRAMIALSGAYRRHARDWMDGRLHLRIDSNGFPLAGILPLPHPAQNVSAIVQVHATVAANVNHGKIEPADADGLLTARDIAVNGIRWGAARLEASTSGNSVIGKISATLLGAPVSGGLQFRMEPGTPARGNLRANHADLRKIASLLHLPVQQMPFSGWMDAGMDFDGPLDSPSHMHALVHVDRFEMAAGLPAPAGNQAGDFSIRNLGALVFDVQDGIARVRSLRLGGNDTGIAVVGSFPCAPDKPLNLTVAGSVDLRIFQLFDSNIQSAGQSLLTASIGGTFSDPAIDGSLQLRNGSFFLSGLPNGISSVNGTVTFDRNRATIRTLTAESGGGKLELGGFVSFGNGPLVYNLEANAREVRMRPVDNASLTANGVLRLSGTSDNSILGGNISVSRIVLNANSDLGALLASVSAPVPSPGNERDFITGLQFDLHVVSAPGMQINSAIGRNLDADIDLRLRGTPGEPVLLGTISAVQGDINLFGNKYTINHAEIRFANPVKIEPTLDLDLQTQAHGVTVNIAVAGRLNKLNINYRSDPPLQPRDIIALLAVGETPGSAANAVNAPTAAETAALESSANTVLGQAISPGSGRLSKLFGITNIKIDPLAQGSTVTPESRLTVQQQISRDITVTYVTNLAQTSEQIFRLEWALNRQYSVVAVRDDNGEFGIDLQYKKLF
jgi:translocation and assembly module TamB